MLKKITSLSLISLCLLVSSCSDNGKLKKLNGNDGRPKIALIMKSLANEFFVTMSAGAQAHQLANADKYELIVNGIKNESDLAQQVRLIDQMISMGVNAIVIAPADSKALIPALARVEEAGIVIVNIDNRLDGEILSQYDLTIPFVGPDDFSGAEMVGNYLAKNINENGKVAILEGIQTAYNSQRRLSGFQKAMEQNGHTIVVEQSADWDQTKAVSITSAILIQHPDIDAILCANDNMALGAVAAIRQAGLSEQVKVVGYDNISAAKDLILSGDLIATADQHGGSLAVYGIEYAIEIIKLGREMPDKLTSVDLITLDILENK